MRNQLAIAGIACVSVLGLGGAASAQISQFLQQPRPVSIDDRTPRTQAPPPAPTSRYFTAAQLRCTFLKVYGEDSAVLRFVFADSTGSTAPHATGVFEAEPNRRTPITNHRVEGGERRFTLKYRAKDRDFEIDFAVKVDGSVSMTQARVDGQVQQRTSPEGSCDVVADRAAAEPERTKPAPDSQADRIIKAAQLSCRLRLNDKDRELRLVMRHASGGTPAAYGTDDNARVATVYDDRVVDQVRYFTLRFNRGVETDFKLTADGRMVEIESRYQTRTGRYGMVGLCQVQS